MPRGYVNLTDMCKANGKKLGHYLSLKTTQEYITAFEKSLKVDIAIPVSPVVIIIQGSFAGISTLQGTWGHIELAMDLAKWINVDFRIWANRVLVKIVHGEFEALTPEAEEAMKKLTKLWEQIRQHGKETRRTLTDAIAAYTKRHPELTKEYQNNVWWMATNAMYTIVFGLDAVDLEKFLGCDRHKSRDFLNQKCLRTIDRAEAGICQLIDNRDIEPCDAVFQYRDFFGVKPMFPSKKLEMDDLN
ncbi:MAG: KilA-N domain-containing protein [Sphaerospermopsis kisseleviana]